MLFRPDGKRVVSLGASGTAKVWDATADDETAATTKGERVFEGHAQDVVDIRCVAFRPDGARLAGGADDGMVRLWDVETGQLVRTFVFDTGFLNEATGVAFRPDGKRLAAASESNGVRVWDAESGRCIVSIDRQETFGLTDLAYSPDGARLVASIMGKVQVWDADTGRLLRPP